MLATSTAAAAPAAAATAPVPLLSGATTVKLDMPAAPTSEVITQQPQTSRGLGRVFEPLEQLVGSPPAFERDPALTGEIADSVFISLSPRGARLTKSGHGFKLTAGNNQSIYIEALRVSRSLGSESIVRIGDRWYRVPPRLPASGPQSVGEIFSIAQIIREPSLWIGNESLVHFIGAENIPNDSKDESPIGIFWDGEPPPEFNQHLENVAATNTALSFLSDGDPYLRLHAVIALVRKKWQRLGKVWSAPQKLDRLS